MNNIFDGYGNASVLIESLGLNNDNYKSAIYINFFTENALREFLESVYKRLSKKLLNSFDINIGVYGNKDMLITVKKNSLSDISWSVCGIDVVEYYTDIKVSSISYFDFGNKRKLEYNNPKYHKLINSLGEYGYHHLMVSKDKSCYAMFITTNCVSFKHNISFILSASEDFEIN